MTKPYYTVAIDGGGTKTQLLLKPHTDSVGTSIRPSLLDAQHQWVSHVGVGCNFAHDFEQAKCHLLDNINALFDKAEIAKSDRCNSNWLGGFAGLNVPAVKAQLKQWQPPARQFIFTTDLHIALLAAEPSGIGNVIITGTGSCAFSRWHTQSSVTSTQQKDLIGNHIQEKMLGGYGFTTGDQASGAWIGRAAIKQTLLALDNLQPQTDFTRAVSQITQLSQALQVQSPQTQPISCTVTNQAHTQPSAAELNQIWYQAKPAQFAQLAHLVFQYAQVHDPIASLIIQRSLDYLTSLIEQLHMLNQHPVNLMGGLAPLFYEQLPHKIKQQTQLCQTEPVYGAFKLN